MSNQLPADLPEDAQWSEREKQWLDVIYTMAREVGENLVAKLEPEQNLTESQSEFLYHISQYYSKVSAVWYTQETKDCEPWKLPSNSDKDRPLIALENNGKDLKKWEREQLITSSEYWSSLWELVTVAQTPLLDEYQQYFEGEPKINELFRALIIQRAWNQFKTCLSPEVKIRKAPETKATELAKKIMEMVAQNSPLDELRPHEKSELQSHQAIEGEKNPYLTYVLTICREHLLKNKSINNAWQRFFLAVAAEHELIIRGLKRTHQSADYPVIHAYNWEHGQFSLPYATQIKPKQ